MRNRSRSTRLGLAALCAYAATGCFGLVDDGLVDEADPRDPSTNLPPGENGVGGLFDGDDGGASSSGGALSGDGGSYVGSTGGAGGAMGSGGLGSGAMHSGGAAGSGGRGSGGSGSGGSGNESRGCEVGTWLLVSKSHDGNELNALPGSPIVSGDANWVLFSTTASNVVLADTNASQDAFLHSVANDTTQRVSLGHLGQQANGDVNGVDVSYDGRLVLLQSYSSNLDPADADASGDVFVRDVVTGTIDLVSVNSNGDKANDSVVAKDLSADGRYVVMVSKADNLVPGDTADFDVFLFDRTTRTMEIASAGAVSNLSTYTSSSALVSDDGRYVSFHSGDPLVAGDTNDVFDVHRRDRTLGITERLSSGIGNTKLDDHAFVQGMSSDGRFMAGYAIASNLVPADTNGRRDTFLYDAQAGTTKRFNLTLDGKQLTVDTFQGTVSPDGRYAAFHPPGPSNYLYDVATGTVRLAADAAQADLPESEYSLPSFSADSTCMALTLTPGSDWDVEFPASRQVFIVGLE